MRSGFTVTRDFPLPPGKCIICQEWKGECVVTPATYPPPVSEVQVCASCVGLMARELGWHEPGSLTGLTEQITGQLDEIRELQEKAEEASKVRTLTTDDLNPIVAEAIKHAMAPFNESLRQLTPDQPILAESPGKKK